ncbi:REP element-mobilizing transposase RayT [Hymenobacter luteus]|uniref:REP element-mobilizing transposase RayT n=2 Tax=Hymenobacter TaxID=89966 RepID=A0A7W9T3I4_9BACT|nr:MULTISPECIES: transposase [Hymenobacter]MBB4603180.1 REP element-mobilizing transposase RayT [Hymenobacter latericoloratus]MBB6060078.1 REP element-mobilizing transposase RayT [Hymenobacter luteus]
MLPPGETILLTLRLAGSIPAQAGRELHTRRVAAQQAADSPETHRRAEKQFFAGFDALLDARTVGPSYLEKEKLAEMVAGELLMLEEQGLQVPCFVVLPNHVHAVLHLPPGQGLSLYKAVELLHQRTATQARRLLRGQLPAEADFWQTGFHELPVLDVEELARIKSYLLSHPPRLQLPERFHDWPYVYLSNEVMR